MHQPRTLWEAVKLLATIVVALPVQGLYDLWDGLKRRMGR